MQTELERLKRERYELTRTLDRCIRAKNIALMYETKSKIKIVENMIDDIERVDAICLIYRGLHTLITIYRILFPFLL